MTRRHGSVLATLSLALGLLVVLFGPAPSASALPSDCLLPLASRPQNVYVWSGGGGANHSWANPLNWEHNPGADPTFLGYPNDDTNNNGAPDRAAPNGVSSVVCISANSFVTLDGNIVGASYVWLNEIYVEGAFTIQLLANNTGLLVDGTANASSFGPTSTLELNGTFGGAATINMSGTITATSIPGFPSQLTSRKICGTDGTLMPLCPAGTSLEQDYTGPAGTLVIKPGGSLVLDKRGVGLSYHYNLDVQGSMTLGSRAAPETPYLAAADGTSLDVMSGGTLTFAGDGGVYRGKVIATQPLSLLRNSGTIVKTGAGTNSVVDTDYSLQPGGTVNVQSGTLTLPQGAAGPAELRAQVGGGSTLGTGTCGAVVPADGGSACTPTVGGADPRSLSVTIPAGNGNGASVQLREDDPTGAQAFDGVTEISGLVAGALAKIQARMPSVPGDANLDTVAVNPETGGAAYPTCLGTGVPPYGALSCVDRRSPQEGGSQVVGGNLNMVVRSIGNVRSRWIVLRGSADVAAPTLYGSAQQKAKIRVNQVKRKVDPIPVRGLRCSEDCTITATGSLTLKGKPVKGKLTGKKGAAAGAVVTLSVKLSKKTKKQVLRSSAKRGVATILVTVTDAAGNPVTMQVVVKVKLKR